MNHSDRRMPFDVELSSLDKKTIWAFGLSAFCAVGLAFLGAAMLVSWQPLADAFASWSLPAWSLPAVGAVFLVGAGLLLWPAASFYSALVLTAFLVAGTALYLRASDWALALLPGALLVLLVAIAALRGPEVREHARRIRELARV